MKILTPLLLIIISIVLPDQTRAQSTSGRITGIITDLQGKPLATATVSLAHASDSTVVKTALSGEDGKFVLKKLAEGRYIIVITSVGFKKFISSILTIDQQSSNLVLPAIAIESANRKVLEQVTVTASKQLVEHKVDRTVVNVDAMITAAGSNALEVLSKSPGVFVDMDGNINLNGKNGVLVLINDKPTYLSTKDLAAYLRSLPAGVLEKVELISNPPAKYDASGSAVINLQLKKSKTPGFNGNVDVGYNQGIYARSNSALNLNYRNKKINVFGGVSYSRDAGRNNDNSWRNYYNTLGADSSATVLNRTYKYSSNGWNVRTGLDYYVSARTTLGVLLTGSIRPRSDELHYTSDQLNSKKLPDSTATGYSSGDYQWSSGGVNLNMQHKMKTGAIISGDLDYVTIRADGSQLLSTSVYNSSGGINSSNDILYQLPADIEIWSAKSDFSLPLKNKTFFEAGVKSSYVSTNYKNDWYNQIGGEFEPDYGKSDHFKYVENINAAYVSIAKEWKRWAIKAGLRTENTQMHGRQPGNIVVADSSFKRSYTDLFPSFFLTRKLDKAGKHMFTISYTKRIRRPNYQQLNPFLFYGDRYSYNTGNPELRPQYMHAFEVKYDYRNSFGVELGYSQLNKFIQSIIQPSGDIYITRPENFGTNYLFNIFSYVSKDIVKGWHLNASTILFHLVNKGIGNGQTINNEINAAELKISNQFRFSKGWGAEISGSYASSRLGGQTKTGSYWNLNAGVAKMILKEKGTLQVNANDIFHTIVRKETTTVNAQMDTWRTVKADTQRIGIAFSYRFGKDNNNRKRNHNTGGAAEEQGRVN